MATKEERDWREAQRLAMKMAGVRGNPAPLHSGPCANVVCPRCGNAAMIPKERIAQFEANSEIKIIAVTVCECGAEWCVIDRFGHTHAVLLPNDEIAGWVVEHNAYVLATRMRG